MSLKKRTTEEVKTDENSQESSTLTRRQFLKKAGASVLALSFGGLLWRAVDQGVFSTGKGPAYEPWSMEEFDRATGAMALVHSAVLASNPHNSQPWLFNVSESSIAVFADSSRGLGTMDPLRREMHMGLGCALENLMLSAEANGYSARLIYASSESESNDVARIELSPGAKRDSLLYQAIAKRHTHRGAYHTGRAVPPRLLQDFEQLCKDETDVKLVWLTTPELRKTAGDLVISATEAIIADEEMSHDSNKWYRDDWNDLQKYRDGLTLDAQGGPLWIRAAGKMLPPVSHDNANQFWLNSTRKTHTPTAAAYGLLAVRDAGSKEERLRAGRIWQRIHLKGTSEGLAMHPLNQPIEMRDREIQLGSGSSQYGQQLGNLMNDAGWEVLFLFRIGYPLEEASPSPRRAVDDVVL
ncbi:twin-arginine translocation signal domain-containing protein [Paenibacillaceae bacterium]|nr:twin-arginine translocation signal domain-containing protein [Paenibacillaceae bacterium]